MGAKIPDQHALNVAAAVQAAVAPAVVFLFGSRAESRHREHSDIDLLILTDNDNPQGAEINARKVASAYMKSNPPRLAVDVVSMTREEFDRCRAANQHIAGQAARYGIVMNGESLGQSPSREDAYPAHWVETKQRLENVDEYLYEFNRMVAENHGGQKLLGFCAQQAVENALKGWLSAYNDDRTFDHDLTDLWEDLQRIEDLSNPEADELRNSVAKLFDCIYYEDPDRPEVSSDWLSKYATIYRYGRTSHHMTRTNLTELHEAVNNALAAITERIHAISGTTRADLWTEGYTPWG